MDVTQLQLIASLGIKNSPDGSHLVMAPSEIHWNHVGTIHAGAIYSLAEAASAHRLLLEFPDLSPDGTAMLRSAEVKYNAPARGELRANAEIARESLEKLRRRLQRKGRGSVNVTVVVFEGDVEVFIGTFNWFVSTENISAI